MNSFDVITVGNATLDNFLWIKETNKHFKLDENTRELSIRMGDKILIDKAYFLVGGNASNVSVGLSRLGLKTAVMAEIGDDEFGQKVVNTLAREGVSDNFLKKNPQSSTSFSMILNYKGDRIILEEKVQKEHDYSFENAKTKWIYLTSIGDDWENAYEKVLQFKDASGAKMAFNPGSAQLDNDPEKLSKVLEKTEIIFVNKEEAATITGLSELPENYEESIKKLLNALLEKGVKIAVITDGGNGAFLIDEKGRVIFQKPVEGATSFERTGAGDSFSSGFLSAVIHEKGYEDAMKWGSLNAASVIAEVGSQPGLLTREEIEQKITQFS